MNRIRRVVQAIEENPVANNLLWQMDGENEREIIGECQETSLPIRGKLDRLIYDEERGRRIIVDLKTIPKIGPLGEYNQFTGEFQASARLSAHCCELGYHRQQWFYRNLVSQAFETPIQDVAFIFIAVCVEPPYEVQAFQMKHILSERGREQAQKALREIADRFASGDWRSPTENEIVEMEAPKWA